MKKTTKKIIKIPQNYKKNSYSKLLYLYKINVISMTQYNNSRKKLNQIKDNIYNDMMTSRNNFDNIHNSWEKLELKRSIIKDFLRILKKHQVIKNDNDYRLFFNLFDTSYNNDNIIHYLIMIINKNMLNKYNF